MGAARLLAAVVLLAVARPAAAQRGTEWQLGAVSAVSGATFVGAGGAAARRASRVRVAFGLSGGVRERRAAGRAELLLGYLLMPGRRQGVGLYAAGGVAVTASRDTVVEHLVAVVGIERAAARRHGWFLEAGVGGGVRIAAGYRWRRLRR